MEGIVSFDNYRQHQCQHDIGTIYKTSTMAKVVGLKPVDTIGNCQRPVFSLGVSQHMHKITKPVKIWAQ